VAHYTNNYNTPFKLGTIDTQPVTHTFTSQCFPAVRLIISVTPLMQELG